MTKQDTSMCDSISVNSASSSCGVNESSQQDLSHRAESSASTGKEGNGSTKSTVDAPPSSVTADERVLGVVHPSGKMLWVPYFEGWTTLDMLRSDVARTWNLPSTDFQVARATPLLSDALLEQQCMPGEILFMLPRVTGSTKATCTAPVTESAQHDTTSDSTKSAPLQKTASFPKPNTWDKAASTSTPHGMHANWFHLPLEEKIVHASHNLLKLVGNAKLCNELQQNLETATRMGIDCSPLFAKVEHHLADLIVHPAGNYLVSKCFDFHPPLIDHAASLISSQIRAFALHKHGSYVIEAILQHPSASFRARGCIIHEVFSMANRVQIATHDSGNFVIQRAIETCPDELLGVMVEGVNAVALFTPHGAKMQKKVQSRMARSHMHHQVAPQEYPPPMSEFCDPYDPALLGSTVGSPSSTFHYMYNQQPEDYSPPPFPYPTNNIPVSPLSTPNMHPASYHSSTKYSVPSATPSTDEDLAPPRTKALGSWADVAEMDEAERA